MRLSTLCTSDLEDMRARVYSRRRAHKDHREEDFTNRMMKRGRRARNTYQRGMAGRYRWRPDRRQCFIAPCFLGSPIGSPLPGTLVRNDFFQATASAEHRKHLGLD